MTVKFFRLAVFGVALLARIIDCDTTAAETMLISPGDRVLFFGDSITEMGDTGKGYVQLVRQATEAKFGPGQVEILGKGISGDKVEDLIARIERDVAPYKPTVIFVYIGINDVWGFYGYLGTSREKFLKQMKELVARLEKITPRVVLCTLSVIGEKRSGNRLDTLLDDYSEIIRQLAADKGLATVDLRAAFKGYLEALNSADAAAGILTSDEVHLNERGNRLVAKEVLRVLGVDSQIDVD
ncbi:MAG: SGNH/GDSL hydrolase family protein [Deltaproteobacteria bacterium]|nr:SGNH/GDSL hydrolase family protein [Deltaproteobacteria bacterium]